MSDSNFGHTFVTFQNFVIKNMAKTFLMKKISATFSNFSLC